MVKNNGVNSLDPPFGLPKRGTIVGYDPVKDTISVQSNEASVMKGRNPIPITLPAPHALFYNNGLFIGSLPAKDTPITIIQGLGGQHHFVSHLAEDLSKVPKLTAGELLIQSTENSFISLDTNSDIFIGSETNNIHVNVNHPKFPTRNLITFTFENENHFTEAYREVGGVVKRDLKFNDQFDADSKLEDDAYDGIFKVIGMDPTATANSRITGPTKNPPLVEHRELIYEYQFQSDIDDDLAESNKYSNTNVGTTFYNAPNRRNSRSDTLSLSLVAPNFLMEEVKGTVVDIFGSILDINRIALAVGKSSDTTLRSDVSTNQQQSYLNIRALERKSIAYHFEINARKDPALQVRSDLDINSDNYNAKLLRSRFFFDVDKEGQFKLNAPASSETGNVSLLVRYENYSTFGPEDNGNPNKFWYRDDKADIFLDSIASPKLTPNSSGGRDSSPDRGSIKLMAADANVGPVDRISQLPIKHGMPHHDIFSTCMLQQDHKTLDYRVGTDPHPIDISYIEDLTDLAGSSIQVAGTNANAGGRSGSINLDGSLEMSIGANTVDRQSLWLDTAGGIIANIGRDRHQRSAIVNFDGDVIMQIGGFGVSGDARFAPLGKDGLYIPVLDLRVFAGGGFAHMLRIDANGITVMTPGYIALHAGQGLKLTSDTSIAIDAETVTIQGRAVDRASVKKSI
jgi:hypothetical protein